MLCGDVFYPYPVTSLPGKGIKEFATHIEGSKMSGVAVKKWSPGATIGPADKKVPEVLVIVWAGNDITEEIPKASKKAKHNSRLSSLTLS